MKTIDLPVPLLGAVAATRGMLGFGAGLLVSPRLRTEFGNGEQFYAKAGEVITLPDRRADRPNKDFLEWHLDEIFQAS